MPAGRMVPNLQTNCESDKDAFPIAFKRDPLVLIPKDFDPLQIPRALPR